MLTVLLHVILLSHWPHVATHFATQVGAHVEQQVASVNGSIEIHGEQQVERLVWRHVWQHVASVKALLCHTYTYPYTRNINLPVVGVRATTRPRRLQNDDISRAY